MFQWDVLDNIHQLLVFPGRIEPEDLFHLFILNGHTWLSPKTKAATHDYDLSVLFIQRSHDVIIHDLYDFH